MKHCCVTCRLLRGGDNPDTNIFLGGTAQLKFGGQNMFNIRFDFRHFSTLTANVSETKRATTIGRLNDQLY